MSENVDTLREMYAAFGRGDIGAILENLTDDVTWGTVTSAQEVPWYRVRDGRDGVGDFFATLDREVEFTDFTPTIFLGSGDDAIVHVDLGYKLKKNGKSARMGSVHVYAMRDGKVASFRAFEDTAAVQSAWNS